MKSSPFEQAARAHAASRAATGTRALYEADLSRWLVFCELERANPAKPKLADATKFRDELAAKLAPLTVRCILAALSSMYEAALAFERPLVTWNPFKRLPRPPGTAYANTEAVSDADVAAILDAAGADATPTGRRDVAILRLLYDIGLRRSSVVALRRDKIVTRDGSMFMWVEVKGGKHVEIGIPAGTDDRVRAWLNNRSDESPFIFPARRGNKHLAAGAINKIINKRAKEAKIDHISPHQFRAAYITSALDAGVPLHEVQASVHHADPNTTLRYDRGVRGTGVTSAVAKFREAKGKEK